METQFNNYSNTYAYAYSNSDTDTNAYTDTDAMRGKMFTHSQASSHATSSSGVYNVICSLTGTRCGLHSDSRSIDAVSFSSARNDEALAVSDVCR